MKAKSEALSTAIYIVSGIILALSLNAVFGLALNTDLPIVAVQSGSMEPAFYKGDLLILAGVDKSSPDIKVGDVIVFAHSYGTTPVVHRVAAINEDGTFQTKGDANPGQLPYEKRIKPEQIKGKSILIIPYLGWIKIAVIEIILPLVAGNIIFIAAAAIAVYFAASVLSGGKGLKRTEAKKKGKQQARLWNSVPNAVLCL